MCQEGVFSVENEIFVAQNHPSERRRRRRPRCTLYEGEKIDFNIEQTECLDTTLVSFDKKNFSLEEFFCVVGFFLARSPNFPFPSRGQPGLKKVILMEGRKINLRVLEVGERSKLVLTTEEASVIYSPSLEK